MILFIMAWEAITALKDIALEQKDNQWSLSLKEDFHKKFESPQNRKKLYEAAKDGLKDLDEASKNTMKQGIENVIKTPDFQTKFEAIKTIPTTTWLNKWALTSEQRGLVSLMYLYGWLKGEKNASPQDVITIFDRTKSGENQPVKPIEKRATVSEEIGKVPSKIPSITQSINKDISIAQPKTLEKPTENIKSFSDIVSITSDITEDNPKISKIIDKIKDLEDDETWNTKRIEKINTEIQNKTNELNKINNKISEFSNKANTANIEIDRINKSWYPDTVKNSLINNQNKIKEEAGNEINKLALDANPLRNEINELKNRLNNKTDKNDKKIERKNEKIQELVSDLKEELENNNTKYTEELQELSSQKETLWNWWKKITVDENVPEGDLSAIKEFNAKIDSIEKKETSIIAKIGKIRSFTGNEWQLTTYLAQYNPKGSTEQPANKNTEPNKIQDIPVAETKEIKKEVVPATKSTDITKPIDDSTKVTDITKENWLTRSFTKKTSDKNLENKNIKEALENGLKNKWYEITYNESGDIIFSMDKKPTKDSILGSSKDQSLAKDKAQIELINQVKQLTGNSNIVEQFKNHVNLGKWQMYHNDKNDQYTYVVNSWRINKLLLDKLNKTA